MLPILKSLFLSFGPLKCTQSGCTQSGRALFDKLSWKQAQSVLTIVQQGHASDPPGVQLYFKTGKKDKYGLPTYRCVRGTNSLEGGVHQNLIRKFGSFGSGPELADAMLAEYRLRHDLNVGTLNRKGHEYKSHYDPWLVQHIYLLREHLHVPSQEKHVHLAVEENALKYRGSNEVFGICPLPIEEMIKIGIENKITSDITTDLTIPKIADTVFLQLGSTLREKNGRYNYVAKYQRTKHAVVSVHTVTPLCSRCQALIFFLENLNF